MNKLIYSIFGISVILSVLLVSCEKSTEWNDNGIPYIKDIRINLEDTILIPRANENGKYDTIRVNKLNINDAAIDTVILGHLLNFTGRFSDDKELSSFSIDIKMIGKQPVNSTDTILKMSKGYTLYGNSRTDTLVSRQNLVLIPNFIYSNGENRPIREGDYSLIVRCVDAAGNESDSTKNMIIIRLLNRETIIQNLDRK